MGAIGLNGAANEVTDSTDRVRTASIGWARWAPVNAAAIVVHAVGGIGLIVVNRGRLAGRKGAAGEHCCEGDPDRGGVHRVHRVRRLEGAVAEKAGQVLAEGAVIPSEDTPPQVAAAQQQLRIAQWVTPAVTAVLIVLGAQQGEQQKSTELVKGLGAT